MSKRLISFKNLSWGCVYRKFTPPLQPRVLLCKILENDLKFEKNVDIEKVRCKKKNCKRWKELKK